VLTGTIDSLCETMLRDWRPPGSQPPVMADEFVARTLMLRHGLFEDGRFRSNSLQDLLGDLRGSTFGLNVASKTDLLLEVLDRRAQDRVQWPKYMKAATKEKERLNAALNAYTGALEHRGLIDFARLEELALERLEAGDLDDFRDGVDALIVDEYQDTNLLQEQIYFAIAEASGGALTVVGDDDQSLYRFRGATVELFSDFADRYRKRFGRMPVTTFLKTNYRSTQSLVDFVSDYVELDADYGDVRVKSKPPLQANSKAVPGLPVLALFRDDLDTLAADLATFIHQVFRKGGYALPTGDTIVAAADGGDVGDCAFLCSSPREWSSGDKPRLPLLLRTELAAKTPPIKVFNPRGEDLSTRQVIATLGGLILEAVDPDSHVQTLGTKSLFAALDAFDEWRATASDFLKTAPKELRAHIQAWAQRRPPKGSRWPRSVPILDLLYAIVHFFPELYDDPEGQVAVEVFTRQLSAADQVGSFRGRILYDPTAPVDQWGYTLPDRSVIEVLREFLAPIASGVIGVNEELIQAFPRDRLSVLSVHQAKGLEFPMVIVDVGSDFNRNHAAQAFKRFPTKEGQPERMEDTFRPYSTLGTPTRDPLDRSFDDLYRQFFVAYSRPQDVLLLVGLSAALPSGKIPNVALGWDRNGVSTWDGAEPFLHI
jgi:DNA helicase II / ATP-dependent DNA helicase PcrA